MKTRNLASSPVSNYKVTHMELLPQRFYVLEKQPLGYSNLDFSHRQTFVFIAKKKVSFWKTACVITDHILTEIDLQDRLSEIVEKTCDALKMLSAQRYM